MRVRLLLVVVPVAVIGLVAAAGSSASGQARQGAVRSAAAVTVSTRKLPKLGTVLVNAKGFTLYMFVPDKDKKVTCVGGCAVVWPPLKIATGQKAVAKGSVEAKLLGSDPNPAGSRVVTYA